MSRSGIGAGALVLLLLWSSPAQANKAEVRFQQLWSLAKTEFGGLTRTEYYIFRAAAAGKVADFSQVGSQYAIADAERWDASRNIQADRISWLCTDDQASKLVSHQGLSLIGVRLIGPLNLQFAKVLFPVKLEGSYLPDGVNIQNASLRELSLSGSHIGSFQGDGCQIERNLLLSYEFVSKGEVRLNGARVGGNFDCSGGHFHSDGPDALFAEGIVIRGDCFLRYQFRAEGRVSLSGAQITGSLDCEDGHFINVGGDALYAPGVVVTGSLYLRDGFEAQGKVSLHGAHVAGQMRCGDAQFLNPGAVALNGEGLAVDSDLSFDKGFESQGELNLTGGKVGGNLDFTAVKLLNPEKTALNAKRLEIGGDCVFAPVEPGDLQAQGEIVLESCKIGDTLNWSGVADPTQVTLNLRFAQCGRVWFVPEGWPPHNQLHLNGLTYDLFYNHTDANVDTLIDWLRRQSAERFRPQPYDQLASVLHKGGYESDAEKILIAKEADRSVELSFSRRIIHWILGLTIGYGYNPWRALWIGMVFVAMGGVVFSIGSRMGLIAATKAVEHVLESRNTEVCLSRDYPRFNPLIYSLDTFVPLLNLHQGAYWLPSSERGTTLKASKFSITTGGLLRLYLGCHVYLGWALTTMLAVGLSGLVQS